MTRYLYTIINMFHHYDTLTNLAKNKNRIFKQITDITINDLTNLSISVLALDFDGVLNSHGEDYPKLEVIVWLHQIQEHFLPDNIFILSNKPSAARQQFFEEHFPGIRFIKGVRKKPYPDGLEAIFKLKNLSLKQRQQVALIDDRLLTGMLATCIAGCQGLYIDSPYTQFKVRPIEESFFQMLRYWERFFLGYRS